MVADQAQTLFDCLINQRVTNKGYTRQIIKNRIHTLMKQWQPMFQTGMTAPLAYSFVKRIISRGRSEQSDIGLPEALNVIGC